MQDDRDFAELVSDLMYGKEDEPRVERPDDESDDEATPEAPDSPPPDEESQGEADTPTEEPAEDDDDAQGDTTPDDESDDEGAAPADDDDDDDGEADTPVDDDEQDDDDEEDEPAEPLFTLPDGRQVPVSEAEKLYRDWQADYTRKRQAETAEQQQLRQALEDQRKLAREIGGHSGMREFLAEHPEAYELLLGNPDETRRLLQSDRELEAFAKDYEILSSSPRLAEAYVRSGEIDTARQQHEQQRQAQFYVSLAQNIDAGIDQLAAHEQYADFVTPEDAQAVKDYVMELGGFDEQSDPQTVMAGLQRLATVFVTPDGQRLDMKLVIDRLDSIKERKEREASRDVKRAEEHNKKVDAELEESKKRTPNTPKDQGGGPAPKPEKTPERKDLQEVLSALRD